MSKKLTLEEANEKLKSKNIIIKNYDGILKPVDAVCLVCGNEWRTQANVLLNNSCGCPKCNHKKAAEKLTFTKESFMESCGKLKNNIVMTGEYTKFQEKTTFHCNDCGYDWETTPYMIKKFKTCPNCTGTRRLTHEEYCERVEKAHGKGAYDVLSQYQSLGKKIKVKHNVCGHIFETNALNFVGVGKKKACGCPECAKLIKSKGENKIKDYLHTNNYIYKSEFTIKGCKDKKNLPFDFAVFKEDREEQKDISNIICLIEYDGIQHFHYEPNGIFTKEKYLITVLHDNIRNEFCKKNNIPLLRIKYTDFNNITKILDDFFSKRSTTIENTPEQN